MARPVPRRAAVTGTLVARSALHVGSGEAAGGVDMPLAVDGRGRIYVPGTSLAGVLRAWCEHAWPRDIVREVWGFQDAAAKPVRSSEYVAPPGQASRILVEDAPLAGAASEEIRDGVGIDRFTGTAADRIKFDRAVLPPGTRLHFELSVELTEGSAAGPMAAHVIRALEAGALRLGAATTRGLGHVVLEDRRVRLERFDSRAGLVGALSDRLTPDQSTSAALEELEEQSTLPDPPVDRVLKVTIAWRARGPVMVRAMAHGLGVDSLPITTTGPLGTRPLLPGSTLKGILRAHAERIVRTVLELPVPADRDEQLDVPLVRSLFGTPAGRGALSVDDCHGTPIDPSAWDAIVSAPSLEGVAAALGSARLGRWQASPHVALDRWTGGAATGRLFSVLEPRDVEWEPLRITVALDRLPAGELTAARALLTLLLDDLAAGRVPIGFWVNRGFGDIEVRDVEVSPAASREELRRGWMAWLESNR